MKKLILSGVIIFMIANLTMAQSTTYCVSKGNNSSLEYISRVKLRQINNVTQSDAGYGDYTSLSTILTKSTWDTIRITSKWAGAVYNEGYGVWIDFNKDGDFADSTEQILSLPALRDSLIIKAFFIPPSALPGPTRMRVSMKYNGVPSSCETFQYGEVEDYTVNIVSSTNNDVYCKSRGLDASEEYINRVDFGGYLDNLTGANGGYGNFTSPAVHVPKDTVLGIKITPAWTGVIYSEGYSVWMDYNRDGDFTDSAEQVLTIPASTTPPGYVYFSIPASVPLGLVRMRVSMKYNGIPTSCETFQYGEVEDYTVNIINKRPAYCRSRGYSVADGYIHRVEIVGNLNNISGSNNGYGDFRWMSAVLVRDSTERIIITPWHRVNNNTGVRAWIDYNGDGDFADSGESLLGLWPIPNPHAFTFTVPASAPLGKTRLRISLKVGGVPGSCDSITNGEVEDYSVYIKNRVSVNSSSLANQRLVASAEVVNFEAVSEGHVYPNPAKNHLNILIDENATIKSVKVVSGAGSIFHHIEQSAKRVDISALRPGMYLLMVETDKGWIRSKFVKE